MLWLSSDIIPAKDFSDSSKIFVAIPRISLFILATSAVAERIPEERPLPWLLKLLPSSIDSLIPKLTFKTSEFTFNIPSVKPPILLIPFEESLVKLATSLLTLRLLEVISINSSDKALERLDSLAIWSKILNKPLSK